MLLAFVASQALALEQKPKAWFGGDLDAPLTFTKDWRYNFYVQTRFGDNTRKFEEFILRPSVYFPVNKDLALWLGYDFRGGISSSRVSAVREQRVWPQATYKRRFDESRTLSLRTRLEVRWRENSSQMAPRFRQRVEFTFDNLISHDVRLDIYDEVILSLHNAEWVQPQLVNQNRVFLGFVAPINHYSDIDVGYMNIYRPRSGEDRMDHVFVVAWGIDVDKVESTPILAF